MAKLPRYYKRKVEEVAALITDTPAVCTHEDFFFHLGEELLKGGFELECRQRGIMGTHVILVKRG